MRVYQLQSITLEENNQIIHNLDEAVIQLSQSGISFINNKGFEIIGKIHQKI